MYYVVLFVTVNNVELKLMKIWWFFCLLIYMFIT